MAIRHRSKLLSEPPAVATGDIAFNLIVFFLVCASTQPDSGRQQVLPRSEQNAQVEAERENLEVKLTRSAVIVNGEITNPDQFDVQIGNRLKGKAQPEDRIVIVKSEKDVPYLRWIDFTSRIEDLGGIITLQLEEEREVVVP
ncbi:MAG: biopolymer transporter ExbD [Planctomycetes bacterium]|nr:biopolymer transporter ExbD [Planctomycetota bacterium]